LASAFAHLAIPALLYVVSQKRPLGLRLFMVASFASILPDADVIAFLFGVAYESAWGHRGFTHSLMFAFIVAVVLTRFQDTLQAGRSTIFWVSFISCISHALLDALTNGGLGVALLWPFSQERFFFPFRPIEVSPIGISNFFTERGVQVIVSELKWVFMPASILGAASFAIRFRLRKRS
jgi:inner membrane protein